MAGKGMSAWRWAVLLVLGAVTAGAVAWALAPWPGNLDFQLSGSGRRAVEVLRNLDDLADADAELDRDTFVIAAYTLLSLAMLSLVPPRRVPKERQLRVAAWIAAVGAPIADLAENVVARRLVDRVAEPATRLPSSPADLTAPAAKRSISLAEDLGDRVDDLAHWMLGWSLLKWGFLFVLVAWAVSLLRQPLNPPNLDGRPDERVPPPRTRARAQAPGDDPDRWRPAPDRVGISCSGGGVRSASFCLGALQALDDRGELARARYVTAVSGGSYLAAATAVAEWTGTWPLPEREGDVRVDPAQDLPTFAPGSPEENWFRRNSSYLASDASEAVAGVGRMLLGMVFNLVLLWLVIFAVARPVGWVLSSAAVHPELRAREPSVRVLRQPSLGVPADGAVDVTSVRALGDRTWEFDVVVVPETDPLVELWRPTLGTSSERERRLAPLVADAGLGRVEDGRVTVVRQPRLRVAPVDQVPAEINADPRRPTLVVQRQPSVRAEGGVAVVPEAGLAERIEDVLHVEDRPRLRQYSGTTGRPSVVFGGRDLLLGLGPLALALLVYLAKILARSSKPGLTAAFDLVIGVVGVIGLLLAVLFLVLPWSVQEIPPRLSRVVGVLPGVGAPPIGADRDAGSILTVLLGVLGLSASSIVMAVSKQFRRRPMLVLKAASVVVLLGLAYVTLTSLVQMAAANGVHGRLTGWGLGSAVRGTPDYLKWFGVVGLLVFLAVVADAHSWSVFPYYKRRLSRAFFLHRPKSGMAVPLPYEIPVPFLRSDVPDETVHPQARIRPARDETGEWTGPELVVCAAANTVDEGVAAAGRRSVSFTFSASEIGGPEVGYVPTSVYFERMAYRRKRDLTIPAAVAMSGAAVSPAMGKASLGPVGRLLAVLNVRLGVWLPSPCWVDANLDRRWWGRPGWTYFARELLGQFRVDHRYVYVSDGGHWENLGLVELFRRGCTRIYCISAAGDGPTAFGTLGEAIALAREEFGIEVDVELEALRAPVEVPQADPGADARTFRRATGPVPLAWQPFARGSFTYPPEPGVPDARPVTGELFVFEANLTAALPWDVHAHAERWPLFPDDSTADQLFGHRQFESYRRLGYAQVAAAFD